MQVPSLIEAVRQPAPRVFVMQFPSVMNHGFVFLHLLGAERRAIFPNAMRRDGHDVRRPIRESDAGPRQRNLHQLAREIGSKVRKQMRRSWNAA